MFSPTDLEIAYVANEQRLYRWLGRHDFSAMKVIAACLLCAYVYWVQKFIHFNQTDVTTDLLYILPYISRGVYLIVLTSVAAFYVTPAILNIALPAICLILSLIANYALFSAQHLGSLVWLPLLFTPGILAIAAAYLLLKKRIENLKLGFAIYSLVHFAWVAGILLTLQNADRRAIVSYLFGFKSILFWFWVSVRSRGDGLPLRELANPMNALRGWPWPKETAPNLPNSKNERGSIWWNGLFNLFLGYTLFFVATALLFYFRESFQKVGFNYAVHILVDVATLNLIPGCARVFGFNFIDATYFSFLAKSPGEVWRRGSVYNFKFNQEFVFWPTLRFFKNYRVALFLAFSMFYLNSLTYESLLTLTGATHREIDGKLETARALSFFFYFLILCVPSRYWSLPNLRASVAQRQWLSVAATHVTNILVLYVAYGLATNLVGL